MRKAERLKRRKLTDYSAKFILIHLPPLKGLKQEIREYDLKLTIGLTRIHFPGKATSLLQCKRINAIMNTEPKFLLLK